MTIHDGFVTFRTRDEMSRTIRLKSILGITVRAGEWVVHVDGQWIERRRHDEIELTGIYVSGLSEKHHIELIAALAPYNLPPHAQPNPKHSDSLLDPCPFGSNNQVPILDMFF